MKTGRSAGDRQPLAPTRFALSALLLLALAASASAQWIALTSAGAGGARLGVVSDTPSGSVTLRPYGELLSVAAGHNFLPGIGAAVGAKLVEYAHPLRHSGSYWAAAPVYLYLVYGVGKEHSPMVPTVSLYAGMGAMLSEYHDWQLYGTAGVKAEWLVLKILSPAVELEWEADGPVATVSVGLGRWWSFGR